jgi:hypothetical protein
MEKLNLLKNQEHSPVEIEIFKFIYSQLNYTVFTDTNRDLQHNLGILGINFEGNDLPVSVIPTLIRQVELEKINKQGLLIRSALIQILNLFKEEHHAGLLDGPIHQFFLPYRKWWGLIAGEVRSLDPIQLMRYDAVREKGGTWRFFETNTACPGGVIHCAKIRNAWLMSQFGYKVSKLFKRVDYAVDSENGFAEFLYRQAVLVSKESSPNIAICSFEGLYKNEVESLQKQFNLLKANGRVSGNLVLGDIRDVRCEGGLARINGLPISLIYNKLDQLAIDPQSEEVKGWIEASKSTQVEFLNSLGASFLTETKRILAFLSDPDWLVNLHLDLDTLAAIEDLIPYTRILPNDGPLLEALKANPGNFVLKADALTRGEGVFLGKILKEHDWHEAITKVQKAHGVVQRTADIPIRNNFVSGKSQNLQAYTDYYGIDLFYWGDSFAGAVSRSHSNMVFNVGSGGKESPTFVIED